MIAQVRRRPPRDSTTGIDIAHRKTIGFEVSKDLRKNEVTVQKFASSPEARLLVGLFDDFAENFVHLGFHFSGLK